MCGRFMRSSPDELLAEWFGVTIEPSPWSLVNYNITPQSIQPIVRLNERSHKREFAPARWGLIPSWAKDASIGLKTFNARSEEIETKPAFRAALKARRCLIPADGFYEWQHITTKERQPYFIALKSRQPLAFAGLWERWHKKDGSALETFTILTTHANEIMAPIHDRMPVILAPEDYARWLDASPKNPPPLELLKPCNSALLDAWTVGDAVGNVRNNSPENIKPVPPPQHTLFD